jgi:hypothetical protein
MQPQQYSSNLIEQGKELVHRSAIVRLGPDMELYTESNHASLGVLSVSMTDDYLLKIVTDFGDYGPELTLSATANVDAQLAAKGIFAGASGGASITLFDIRSSKNLSYGGGSTRLAYTRLPPTSSVFNSNTDNLWINFLSIRDVVGWE